MPQLTRTGDAASPVKAEDNSGATYKVCTRCIMDTSDPEIRFDDEGVCDHCKRWEERVRQYVRVDADGAALAQAVGQIKVAAKGRDYDCVIGVSGGVDSTYAAYKVKELGLRPLAVHLDNGWNSELAVSNIEKTLNKLDIDLYTHVIDWEEFKDLQLSFIKSGTPDWEIPTDHAIVALLYQSAVRHGVPYILIGSNVRTEGVMPISWSRGHGDWVYIKNVHKQFGSRKLTTFPHYSRYDFFYYRYVKKIKWLSILNYIDYNKPAALETIEKELGWRNYGGKHYESIYTRFYQGYVLPRRFGYDKRRAHLSSLILAGQMGREEALKQVLDDPYPSEEMKQEDLEFFLKKFELSEADFKRYMELPHKTIFDYPSFERRWDYRLLKPLLDSMRGGDRG